MLTAVYVIVAPLRLHHRPQDLPRICSNPENSHDSVQAMDIRRVVVPSHLKK